MSCHTCPTVFEMCVNEGAQKSYLATLLDKSDVAVPLSALTDIVLTLKDYTTGDVINSRNVQSVKNTNGGTFHATSGLLTMAFDEDDNIIASAASRKEKHIATFLATWSGGQHQWDVIVQVKNLGMTT